MAKKKGYRLIAAIYENERVFRATPENVWGYRFFDETGKKKTFDVSVKDLLNSSKKDMYNAISLRCYHAHLVKSNGALQISCEDGDFAHLPCITRDGTSLTPALPIVYELFKKDDEVVEYGVVAPSGSVSKFTVDALKTFILTQLNGRMFFERDIGPMKGYNLTMYTRRNAKSVSYVLARSVPAYEFPETVIK